MSPPGSSSNGAGPLTSLSLRLLMQGKEVGSIIGKGGEVVRRFREDSRARINISAGTTPDRVVTVQGTTDATAAAFRLVADKLQETQAAAGGSSGLTLRLIVPASQCGSIIGKGGGKIKELRDETGASIQVAKEMLPGSTDRTVTLAGSVDEVCHCVQLIGYIMLESPPKGANIPYEPNNTGGSPFGAGNFGGPNNGNFGGNFNNTPNFGGGPRGNFGGAQGLLGSPGRGGPGGFGTGANNMPLGNSPLSGLLRGLGNLTGGSGGGAEALAALAGRLNNSGDLQAREGTTTHEMKVPNEQVGAVIGKGGAKIAEIRAATGAMVTISKFVEGSEDAAKQERTITIKGSADQVALAIYLINNR